MSARLVWPLKFDEQGMQRELHHVNLPFQIIETINESTSARENRKHDGLQQTLFNVWEGDPGQTFDAGWKNKLIWGENKYVISSLAEKFAGKLDLIYIDPPFATGADFSFRTEIGEQEVTKSPSTIEMKVYNDTWGEGRSSYVQMIYERLSLMRDLLSAQGSIYVHLDANMVHYVKVVMDELFGEENFLSEIIWKRTSSHNDPKNFGNITDRILYYVKSEKYTWNPQYTPLSKEYIEQFYRFTEPDGRRYRLSDFRSPHPRPNLTYDYKGYKPHPNGWAVSLEVMKQLDVEGRLVFPKSKDGRIQRKTYLDSNEGQPLQNLWTDVPPIYATSKERLGYPTQKPEALLERIISSSSNPNDVVADFFCGSGTTLTVAERLGRRWIGCDLSRFAIHASRKRLLEMENCKPFEILNLGKYERQVWQSTTFSANSDRTVLYQYLAFILRLYKAEPIAGFQSIHGRKGGALVHVGAVDSPVTIEEVISAIRECSETKQTELHILGWEWEMGLDDLVKLEAKNQKIKLRLLVIPKEVIQADLQKADEVEFYDLAYIKAMTHINENSLEVELLDFAIPNPELIPESLKIKHWSDLIDYWALDFDFQNDTFMNQWSCYRTQEKPTLSVKSTNHVYLKRGLYRVVLKIVDVFGIDSSRLFEVRI